MLGPSSDFSRPLSTKQAHNEPDSNKDGAIWKGPMKTGNFGHRKNVQNNDLPVCLFLCRYVIGSCSQLTLHSQVTLLYPVARLQNDSQALLHQKMEYLTILLVHVPSFRLITTGAYVRDRQIDNGAPRNVFREQLKLYENIPENYFFTVIHSFGSLKPVRPFPV